MKVTQILFYLIRIQRKKKVDGFVDAFFIKWQTGAECWERESKIESSWESDQFINMLQSKRHSLHGDLRYHCHHPINCFSLFAILLFVNGWCHSCGFANFFSPFFFLNFAYFGCRNPKVISKQERSYCR